MTGRNRPQSKRGLGPGLGGAGPKPPKDAGKRPAAPNIDTDSSIVSLTSSNNSDPFKDLKTRPDANKDAMKESNSMLSTDLYPTRDTEAEQVSDDRSTVLCG